MVSQGTVKLLSKSRVQMPLKSSSTLGCGLRQRRGKASECVDAGSPCRGLGYDKPQFSSLFSKSEIWLSIALISFLYLWFANLLVPSDSCAKQLVTKDT